MTGFFFCARTSDAPNASSIAKIAVKPLKLNVFFIFHLFSDLRTDVLTKLQASVVHYDDKQLSSVVFFFYYAERLFTKSERRSPKTNILNFKSFLEIGFY